MHSTSHASNTSRQTRRPLQSQGNAPAIQSRRLARSSRRSFVAALGGAALAAGAAAASGLLTPSGIAGGAHTALATDATNAALSDAQARFEAAQAQLSQLNNAVFDAEAVYEQISSDLAVTVQRIDELQVQITERQAELDGARSSLASRIAANYKAGTMNILDVLMDASSFEDLANRIYFANKISDADAQLIQTVIDIQNALQADQDEMNVQRQQQEDLLAQQQAQMQELQSQVAAAESYVASLDSEVQALMAQQQQELAAQAEAARLAAEAAAAAQAESGSSADAQVYSGPTDYGSGGSTGVESADAGSYSGGGSSGNTAYQPSNVVAAAYAYLGTPYSVLDCSGLTSAAYADCGYSLYHQSGVQYSIVSGAGNLVYDVDSLVPGNLVFYQRNGSIYHVAMYIGGGQIIESIPSSGVAVHSIYYCDGYCGGGSPF